MKIVHTFGEEQVIYEALRKVDNTGGDIERCQKKIAHDLAGKELVNAGVNLVWELAVVAVARELMATPGLTLMMDFLFDDSMSAIIDNPAFLDEVIAFRNETRESLRGKTK